MEVEEEVAIVNNRIREAEKRHGKGEEGEGKQ